MTTMHVPQKLTRELLEFAAHELAQRDHDLAGIFEHIGAPPMWARPAGFATLVHIILEQQVSLASAKAAFRRLEATLGENLTPAGFLTLNDAELKSIGFSRQKTTYARHLAQALLDGKVNLDQLSELSDEAAKSRTDEVERYRSLERRKFTYWKYCFVPIVGPEMIWLFWHQCVA